MHTDMLLFIILTPMCGPDEDLDDSALFSVVPRRGGEVIGRRRNVYKTISRHCAHDHNNIKI